MSEEQTPVETVPPASRLGEIVGWGLLALAVACFIASIVAIVRADAASQAIQHAEDAMHTTIVAHSGHEAAASAALVAADNSYREARVLTYVMLSASLIFLSLIPGLLYAMKPSLLGGPLGRLLHPYSAKLARRQPPRRHPVTFYQGIGLMLNSLTWISMSLLQAVATLTKVPFDLLLGLNLLTLLLYVACLLVGSSLIGQATWWYTGGRSAGRGQERLQA
jgi:apolipoprotein N-acyltransferase